MILMLHGTPLKYGCTSALAVTLLAASCMDAAFAAEQVKDSPPEFKMILSPGTGNAESITFSAEEEKKQAQKQGFAAQAEKEGAVVPKAAAKYRGFEPDFRLTTGYRRDNLNFSIASVDGYPNVISELTWEDVQSATLGGSFRWSNSSKIYLRGGVDLGWILTGDVQDSDYLGDNRTYEFSRSYADTKDGSLLDAEIGIGYRLEMPFADGNGGFRLMPLVGYAYSTQEFEMSNGVQAVADYGFAMELGPFDDLKSTYDTTWDGFWIGFDMDLDFNPRHSLSAAFEYHWVDFEADADWNLRTDLAHPVSFQHSAGGEGYAASLTYRYTPTEKWFASIGFSFCSMTADPGDQVFFFADGTEATTMLNEVEWESFNVMVGLGYKF